MGMKINPNEPLGLPNGSVRAFLTTLLVGITAAVMFLPIPAGKDDVKAMFVLLTGIAVRDYFSSRDRQSERQERTDERVAPDPA
ncbi:MAG: hypothetical protein ACRDNI_00405 [Gaiellaceae bacterium]